MILLDLLLASGLVCYFSDNVSTLLACLIATCCLTFLRMSVIISYWSKILDNMIEIEFQDKEENK